MTENEQNWAKAENTDVEQAKDAFADAQAADALRVKLTEQAAYAVGHGVDRTWMNGQLAKLGAAQVTGTAEYRMNIPITGVYGWRTKANSRAEALTRFKEQVARIAAAGKITADGSYDNVYNLVVAAEEPTFHGGPEDPATEGAEVLDLDGLKAGIRAMVKQGVSEKGWDHYYANQMLGVLGLDKLPNATSRTVSVPVSGIAEVSVLVFEDDGDGAVQAAVAGAVTRAGYISIRPEEIGAVAVAQGSEESDEFSQDDGGC